MKLTTLIAATALSVAGLRAQSVQQIDKPAARRQLLQIEAEIGRANRDCDYDYFRRVEAAEFIFTDAKGSVSTRADDLAGEKDCKKRSYAQTIDEDRVLFYGSFAVVNARNTITTTSSDGQPVAHRDRFTDVFVWRDGRWQLVSGHSSRITE
jgi:ketosteroid isomerase-like protein